MKDSFITKLRKFVDGEADTAFEYILLFVVIVNVIVLGLETLPELEAVHGRTFFLIDQICLWIFIAEFLVKVVAFNREFFGEYRLDILVELQA